MADRRASFRVLFSLLLVALLHSTAVNGDVSKLKFNKQTSPLPRFIVCADKIKS